MMKKWLFLLFLVLFCVSGPAFATPISVVNGDTVDFLMGEFDSQKQAEVIYISGLPDYFPGGINFGFIYDLIDGFQITNVESVNLAQMRLYYLAVQFFFNDDGTGFLSESGQTWDFYFDYLNPNHWIATFGERPIVQQEDPFVPPVAAPVPEPGTIILLGVGIIGMVVMKRKGGGIAV